MASINSRGGEAKELGFLPFSPAAGPLPSTVATAAAAPWLRPCFFVSSMPRLGLTIIESLKFDPQSKLSCNLQDIPAE